MAEAVKALPQDIQALIEVRQWDMRTLEGIRRMQALKARSLPALAIDDQLVFQSQIPTGEVLSDRIVSRYLAKITNAV
jgi:hypothetical protein